MLEKKKSSVLVQTLEPSVCPHPPDLPPFLPPCFFTACVDVDRTHSNVHLCCFHSGKNDKKSCVSLRHLTVSSSFILVFEFGFFFTPHPLCSCVRPSFCLLTFLHHWPLTSGCFTSSFVLALNHQTAAECFLLLEEVDTGVCCYANGPKQKHIFSRIFSTLEFPTMLCGLLDVLHCDWRQ